MVAISTIGIIICFALLIISSWKNISTFLIAVLGAGIVGLLGGLGFVEAITGPYMTGFVGFVQSWIVVFALGGLLGGLYTKSGAAWRIGDVLVRKAGAGLVLIAYILFGAIMVYGGISAPLTLFILLPLARVVFPKVGIPWYLFPGITGLATITFAMYMPGSLYVVNLIPTQIMGVSTTAAPVEGIAASLFLLIIGVIYLKWEIKKGQGTLAVESPEHYLGKANPVDEEQMGREAPPFVISIIPLALALILANIVKLHILLSLGAGCAAALILFWKHIPEKIKTISTCFNDGIMPCILVSAVTGLGGVISATPAFEVIRDAIMNLPIGGLVKVALSTTLISGVCASGSGGVQMTLSLFGDEFLSWGYSPEIIARVASIACGGLDSLPWNGSIVTMCGASYSKGYKQVFVLTAFLPIVASLVAALTYSLIH